MAAYIHFFLTVNPLKKFSYTGETKQFWKMEGAFPQRAWKE
jgi:hypothetical protein